MAAWAHHWLFEDYWVPTWPNAAALPLSALAAVIGTYLFRRPLGRAWLRLRAHLHDPVRQDLAEIRALAERAHRIAADTYRLHAGHDHPDAPGDAGGTPQR